MKKHFQVISLYVMLFFTLGLFVNVNINEAKDMSLGCFSNSLHATGEGMRYWYETEGGFMDITQIEYNKLGCKNCHVKSCDTCHLIMNGDKCSYSTEKARDMDTCLKCHSRAKTAIKLSKKNNLPDVHFAEDMICSDCHQTEDIHGQGISYQSMRDEGAVQASCQSCHKESEDDIRPHKVHKGKLDCAACHVSNSLSCLNCHFDNFLKTGNKKESFLSPVQDWTLLINYNGKVTSGTVQTLVYKDKKFIAYAPYFTHAIQSKGKKCVDCHDNEAVKLIKKGKKVPMLVFKDNKAVSWSGTVPLIPENLKWAFLNKTDEGWVEVPNNNHPQIQMINNGKPLTKKQLEKLAKPYKK